MLFYPAFTGEDALRKYQSAHPELILLGLFLPDMGGMDLLRRLRSWTSVPILVMSARGEESEIIACLDSGADDYLTIPFTMGELLARIRAALRRAFGGTQGDVFTAGELRVDFNRREVFVGREQVVLTATEYHLLNVLVRHAGRARTHHQLIHEVWGSTQYQDAVHLLRVTVSNLRRKLSSDSGHHLLPIVTNRAWDNGFVRFLLRLLRAGEMKRKPAITCIFVDIGGVLLTNGWDHHARRRAVAKFKLDWAEIEERHRLTFEIHEEGKLSFEEYLSLVVFYEKRPFTGRSFGASCASNRSRTRT